MFILWTTLRRPRPEAGRLLAAMVIGMVLGASTVLPLTARHLERLYREREVLLFQLGEYHSQVTKLRASLESRSRSVVQETRLEFTDLDNEDEILALRKLLRPHVEGLLGKEVRGLDPNLVVGLLDRRSLDVDGRRFLIRVRAVVLAERTLFLLLAEKQEVTLPDSE